MRACFFFLALVLVCGCVNSPSDGTTTVTGTRSQTETTIPGASLGIPFVPDMIAGRVLDAETGKPLDGVDVVVTGSRSGLLWKGKTEYNPYSGYHGEYSSAHTLTWAEGENLTVTVSNRELGYSGVGYGIAPEGADLVFIDVHASKH